MASLALYLSPVCKSFFPKICFVHSNHRACVHFFSSTGADGGSGDPLNKSGPALESESTLSSSLPPPPQSPPSTSRFSSYFSDVKSSLSQEQRLPQQRPSQSFIRKPSPFQRTQENVNSLDEIRKKLSDFKARTAAPPPTELQRGDGAIEADPGIKGGGLSLIRESLRELGSSGIERGRRVTDPSALTGFRNSLRLGPPDRESPSTFGSRQEFGNEVKGKKEERGQFENSSVELVKVYNYHDLGEKLRNLRPPKTVGKTDWFSFSEMNQRLVKLRSIELQGPAKNILGVPLRDLRESLLKVRLERDTKKKAVLNRFGLLGRMQETSTPPPPKEHLLERYLHPDNMSEGQKSRLKVKKVAQEFRICENDSGSVEMRVARLTVKINHCKPRIRGQNHAGKRYVQSMINRRKRYLIYLKTRKFESYCYLIQKLRISDINVTVKAPIRKIVP